MPISVEVRGLESLEKQGERWKNIRKNFIANMRNASNRFGSDAVKRSKLDYMKGPRPLKLNRISGYLSGHMNKQVSVDGNTVTTRIGNNMVYARIHELGFLGQMQIKAHQRVVAKVFGRPVLAHKVDVRAHSRTVNMPKRPYIRPGIDDALPDYRTSIQQIRDGIGD